MCYFSNRSSPRVDTQQRDVLSLAARRPFFPQSPATTPAQVPDSPMWRATWASLIEGNKIKGDGDDEPPKVVKKIHPSNCGADMVTRQRCMDQLYQAMRQLVKPGQSYSTAQNQCYKKELYIWLNSVRKTYCHHMRCATDVIKCRISKFTLKYYGSISPVRTALFLPNLKQQRKGGVRNPENGDAYPEISFYSACSRYLLTEDQLREEGFPRRENNNLARFTRSTWQLKEKPKRPEWNNKVCVKCGALYKVDQNGLSNDTLGCSYHLKRSFTIRVEQDGDYTKLYDCCGCNDRCTTAKYHAPYVFEYTNLQGFVEAQPPQGREPEEGWDIFSIDCEMYYSSEGLELGRVSVVNAEHRVVYDTCVRPEKPIADCVTSLSGLTEDALMKSRVTLGQVQNALLGLFNSNTILVGHSLENDLKVLKLVHSSVIDTAVLYQTEGKKPSLRTLAATQLNEAIQCGANGHDSIEDAITCLKLLRHRVEKDARRQRHLTFLPEFLLSVEPTL
ncbi:RNA exonuclease 1 [Homalodisca vitripennis]|nr:RNA exonuclease 1 [Homalodisca vitripennis]